MKNDSRPAPPRVLPMGAPPVRRKKRSSARRRFADREVRDENTRIAPIADRRPSADEQPERHGREDSGWLRHLMHVQLTWLD